MKDLVAAGQAHGVPIAAVLTPSRILASEHFQAVGAITDAELVPGVRTERADRLLRRRRTSTPVSGRPAPAAGAGRTAAGSAEPATVGSPRRAGPATIRSTGLRILDLGIIVAGGELSRLFGDLGAEVIKVESAAYPDGLRQARVGEAMSESFAWTHRNHLAFGLDLRSAPGQGDLRPAGRGAPTRCSPTSSREPLPRLGFPTTHCAR